MPILFRPRRPIALVLLSLAPGPWAAHAQHSMTDWGIVVESPEMQEVRVRTDLVYPTPSGAERPFHLYLPPNEPSGELPLVVMAAATGQGSVLDRAQYRSWARYVASSGMAVAIADTSWGTHVDELRAFFGFVRTEGERFGIRSNRIGAFAVSGNVMGFYSVITDPRLGLACAALYYGAPASYSSPGDTALFLARAGRDAPDLNRRIEELASRAMQDGATVELVNHADGHHAFDILDDTPRSRAILSRTVAFFRERLLERDTDAPSRSPLRRALAHYSYQEWEEAAAAYTDHLAETPDDGRAWLRLAMSNMNLERHARAARAFERAAEADHEPAAAWYNAACMHALAGDRPRSLAALRESSASGFDVASSAPNDADLASLRGDPEFAELVGDRDR